MHSETSGGPDHGPTVVVVSLPIERNVTDYADFTGRTEAVKSVEIRPVSTAT